jgi:hypothetical protein
VQFVKTPEAGVPSAGLAREGESLNTNKPVPVSFVTAANKFADDGVARKVAIPEASPLTPVLIGRPVQFVRVPLVGVPSAGVTNVAPVCKTTAPEPVVLAAETELPLPKSNPLMVVPIVIAGVEVAVATVPEKPFAVATETLVTVPVPVDEIVKVDPGPPSEKEIFVPATSLRE